MKNPQTIIAYQGFIFAVLIYICSFDSNAVDVEVSEAKINKTLAETFPVKRTFKGISADFTDPKILLNPLDETIKIAILINSKHQGGFLLAKGKLEGKLEYDEFDKQLKMEKPILDDFEVIESDLAKQDLADVSKVVQQSMGRNLPEIIVVDLDRFEIRHPRTPPKSIDVGIRRLVIEL